LAIHRDLEIFRGSQAEDFYGEHRGKPFYDGLVEFMTSGPVVVMTLQRKYAPCEDLPLFQFNRSVCPAWFLFAYQIVFLECFCVSGSDAAF